MPVRTTPDLVEEILEEAPDKSLAPFIKAASRLVDRCCSSVEDYTDELLQEIETWLAAHVYCTLEPQALMQQAGSVQETVSTKVDLGLDNSRYGQFVKRLDWNGGLAALDNAVKTVTAVLPAAAKSVGITWLGTTRE